MSMHLSPACTGEQARRIRDHDWSGSPLGPPEQWPTALRTLVSLMLEAHQPMFVVWGKDQLLLYNDRLRPILGSKHPDALARPFLEVWKEVESDMRPIVEAAYNGTSTQMDDIRLIVDRSGTMEEAHFSFSFTPIRSDGGGTDGFFCACTETTAVFDAARALEAREEERARFVRLAENSRDFVAMADKDRRVFYVNEAGRRIVGLENQDISQFAIADFFPPDQAKIVAMDVLPAVLREGHWTGELSFRNFRTGEWIPVLSHVFPITNRSGDTIGFGTVTRDFRERKKSEEALLRSEAKWRGIFESLREGFILGELVRDVNSRVVDWRYEEVNEAWHDLVGIERGSAEGRTIRDLFPGIEEEWVSDAATVVETGAPIRFTRQVGALGRWYEGVMQQVGGDRFSIIFLEVTERVSQERRQGALLKLGDELRDLNTIEGILQAATDCITEGLDADRYGFGFVDDRTETINVPSDTCAPGVASVAGHHAFRSFGSYIDDLMQGETVAIPDITTDPRTRASADALIAIQTRSLLNLPIRENGRLVLVVFAHGMAIRPWTCDELRFIQQVGDRMQAAIGRLRAEARQDTLNHELAHRMKNTLAIVQAITTQTLRQAETMEAGRLAIASRLSALARAQDLLTHTSWQEADVRDVARAAIEPHRVDPDRIAICGPYYRLNAQQALGLSLAIHELATNAAKYGALSTDEGHVDISWSCHDSVFTFRWIETGGPAVVPPTQQGFGSKLIEQIVGAYFDGTGRLDYAPDGVRFELTGGMPSPAA